MPLTTLETALVGRERERETLREAFARAQGSEPAAVVLSGEAGIGKSRLVRDAQESLRAEADVHVGWCLDLGAGRTPYGALTAVLRSLVATLGVDEALAAVGAGADALRMLLPELSDAPVDRAATSPEGIRDAIATLVETAAARAPQVIVIEDMHWADASTLLILSFLIRTLERGRILFLLTFRTEDVRRGDAASRFLADLARVHRVERLALGRLDAEASRALGEQVRGGRAVTDAQLAGLAERAEGVPFFIEELACGLDGPMPDGLRDVLLVRYDALDESARHVVRVASASADGVLPHVLLARLSGLDDAALDAAVRSGIESGVLVMRGDGYSFRHALLREAVHDDLLPGERARLHGDYAEALEDGVTHGWNDPATMAFHWQHANDAGRALRAAIDAMFAARESYAFASAARFGELALELWDRVPDAADAGIDRIELLQRLASIMRNAGEGDRALATIEQAVAELDEETIDPALHVRVVRDRAQYLGNLGRPGKFEMLQAAQALVERSGLDDPHLRATVLRGIASCHMLAGRTVPAVIAATAAAQVAGDDCTERSIALNLRACSLMLLGEVAHGQRAFDESAALARDDRRSGVQLPLNLSDSLTLRGRYREAVGIAESGLERARMLGVERSTGDVLLQNMIEPLLALGDIERAERLLPSHDQEISLLRFGTYLSTSRVRALAWRGEIEAAERLRDDWRPRLLTTATVERQVWYYLIEMDVAIAVARGEWGTALDLLVAMVGDAGPALSNQRRLLLEGGWIVAEARAAGGRTEAAAAALRAAWDAQPDGLRDRGWTLVLHALTEPSRESLDAALRVVDGEDIPAVLPVAVRLESARLHAADGDRRAASALVAEAEERAAALHHAAVLRQTAALAAAVGRRGAPGADDELTARERQVLALIAEGLSNRQIGERLFISAKTASVHVSAILRKLGVATRTEAALRAPRG